jgi:N-acetylglutamate synthase-like GNAT family acetyltransferase
MMPVGPRTKNSASARIAVPRSLPPHLRSKMRELVAVKSDNPGNGEADALLDAICCEADETKTALMLMVDGGDRERLANWYQRHGFTPIQAEPLLMARFA